MADGHEICGTETGGVGVIVRPFVSSTFQDKGHTLFKELR